MRDRGSLRVLTLLVIAASALLVGCELDSTDPRARAAEQVLRDTMAQDPAFTRYALNVAAHSTSPVTEQVIGEQLSAPDFEVANAAVDAALRRASPAHRDALQQLFQAKQGAAKLGVAGALAALGDEQAIEWVRQNARDASGAPVMAAVKVLQLAGDDESLRELLMAALESEDRGLRDATYAILAEMDAPWRAEVVREGLEKEFGEDRRSAIVALGRVGNADDAARLQRFLNTKGLVFATVEALGNLGNENAVPALEAMLDHDEEIVRVYVVAALDKLGQEERTKETLDGLMVAEDWKVRRTLAEQMASVGTERSLSVLATLAGDGEPQVRAAAVRALRDLHQPAVESIFVERVADDEYEVASVALDALGRVGSRESLSAIEPLLQDDNGYVAISAACAILDVLARHPAEGA